jgi:2-isopropylmalate synthase
MEQQRKKIIILDTTLRDGEQCPGMIFSIEEKLALVSCLENLGVDIIEAGFPASSDAQYNDVKTISESVQNAAVSAMARALESDIEIAGRAIKNAKTRYIHITISTSPIHRELKLKKTRKGILKMAADSIYSAKGLADYIEIGAEDATRTEYDFLEEFCMAVTEAGAGVVNISDTVGYSQPVEFSDLICNLYSNVPAFYNGTSRLSIHCHNDLGLATANTLAGLKAGASQAETTLMGIGERAGNAPLEELAMAIKTRTAFYDPLITSIKTELFADTARFISKITGIGFSPVKPITGINAYTHVAGIHQNGMTINSDTYSLIKPEQTGYGLTRFVLSRSSGLSGLINKIEDIGYQKISSDEAMKVYARFKKEADTKKVISPSDILMILFENGLIKSKVWRLIKLYYSGVESQIEFGFSIIIELEDQYGTKQWFNKSGYDKWNTVITVMKSFFHYDIKIIEYKFSLAGDEAGQSGRFYFAAEFEGKVYYDESYGKDYLVLFIECYLNVVNQINVRFQFE